MSAAPERIQYFVFVWAAVHVGIASHLTSGEIISYLYSQYELASSLLKVWQPNPRLKAFRNLILIRTESVCGQRAACNATVARPALALLQTSQLEPAPSRPAGRRTGIGRTRRSAGRLAGRGLAGGAAIAADFSVAAAAAVTPREPQSRECGS